ncbi:MAG: hypothetical protein JSW17_03900 [Candidatus Omnitrophota bacterium]|nr:MAG: hypothetical protein JSW17_03900 [Candidatus Omnitrophota bacterium]
MKIVRIKLISLVIFLIAFNLGGAFGLYAETIPLKKIVEDPDDFESKLVEVEGEVIGEPLYAKEGAWVNILSKGYHAGIVVPRIYLDKIKHWGGYRESGDIAKVRGKFYKECPLHHEMHIHAHTLEIIALGAPKSDVVLPFKVQMAVSLFIICLIIGLVYFIKSRHGTRS